ncbi:MAG: sigW 7 [Planctomycetaceae bacterium]|nr:sigW 7 [Planctomycetaceae bacterium]
MDYTALNDDELMRRIQAGEKLAFEAMVDRYQNQLQGFFFRKNRDLQLAEDLTQDTFLRLLEKSWDFLPSGRFRGWLFRIAYNILIDDVRRRGGDALTKSIRNSAMGDDDVLARMTDTMLGPEAIASGEQFREIVNELLATLSNEQRMTFILHHFEELSLPEVADAMRTLLPTTKSRLRLAREKLRTMLLERNIVLPLEHELDESERNL